MAELATIAAVVGAGAAVVGAYGSYTSGVAAQDEANRQAQVDELNGKNAFAASQREADQRKLEGQLIASRAQAYAAASGAGADGDAPTITKILTDIGRNAQFGEDSVLFQGQQAQADYNNDATARRATGQNNYFGGILRAVGTLAGGIGQFASSAPKLFPTSSSRINFTPATGNLY